MISANNETIGWIIADAMDRARTASTVEEAAAGDFVGSPGMPDRSPLACDPSEVVLRTRHPDSKLKISRCSTAAEAEEVPRQLLIIADDTPAQRWRRWSSIAARHAAGGRASGRRPPRRCFKMIAILTNGRAITEDLGIKLESIKLEDLAKRRRSPSTRTTRDRRGRWCVVAMRPRPPASRAGRGHSSTDREKLERLAKLSATWRSKWRRDRDQMKEKKARVEDAMHATKAAAEEGIVPAAAWRFFARVSRPAKLGGDQQIGVNIVARAIEVPMR
jgi:hypothetical protein